MERLCVHAALLLSIANVLATPVATAASASPPRRGGEMVSSLSHSPLRFEPNIGQMDPRVQFLVRGQRYAIYLTPEESLLALPQGNGSAADPIRLRLVNSRPTRRLQGEGQLQSRSNYFIGSDPTKWHHGVPHFARVTQPGVYPGVDLTYYGNEGRLEYDYVVAPGADPDQIAFAFEGAKGRLDEAGNIVLETTAGVMVQNAPVAYQEVAGARNPIASHYRQGDNGEFAIVVGAYDPLLPLVIDPVLVYSTYLGGSAGEEPRAVAVDDQGAVYLAGYTNVPSAAPFPTTSGAYQSSPSGGIDVFVSKLNPAGAGEADLVYSTYLGGAGNDFAWGLAVDSSGSAYVVGGTDPATPGFPVTIGAFQTLYRAATDGFLVKLDPLGGVAYSTYLGGSSFDEVKSVAVDADGTVYMTGITFSGAAIPFPTTSGAYQTTNAGGYDAFVVKLNPRGSGAADLVYSTLFGGSALDLPQRIRVHGSQAYIAGYSEPGGPIPTTVGAYQAARAGSNDAFLAVINPVGQGSADLVYATHLGGSGLEVCSGLAVDASGAAYLGGYTTSTAPVAFPTTQGAFQTSLGGSYGMEDVFVTKLIPAGNGAADLAYSTYLGGPYNEYAIDLAIDDAGTVFVTGIGGDYYPTTPDAYQRVSGGLFDTFLTRLNPAGRGVSDLLYSTLFGGSENDHANAIAVAGEGRVFMAGSTFGSIPTTPGAFQAQNAGSLDAFLAAFQVPQSATIFLHGDRGSHPGWLTLDQNAPTVGAVEHVNSGPLKSARSWIEIASWSANPTLTSGSLDGAEELHAWLGLEDDADLEARFDLGVEILKNGDVAGVGELHCIEGLLRDPGQAREVSIPFDAVGRVSFDGASDRLSLRLLARLGTDTNGRLCSGGKTNAGLRVYFDAVDRPARFSIMLR